MIDIDDTMRENVLLQLEHAFGKSVALLIVASATSAAAVPTSGLDESQYKSLIGAICCDHRVRDMWGDQGAEQARARWVTLI